MEALTAVFSEVNGDTSGLKARMKAAANSLANFEPGQYQPPETTTGQVVLAELFTGCECGPCAAADFAFDALRDYYPRTRLAILEFHQHIPRPDPMTNYDSDARYQYYGANFGTPTVFINGTDKMVGGGPKIVTKNRFTLYSHTIEKHLKAKPGYHISGLADLSQDQVKIDLQIKSSNDQPDSEKNPLLNIALVERSVDFSGSNGVDHHAFVVRKLVNGGEGKVITIDNQGLTLSETIQLKAVEIELADYIKEYAAQNANRITDTEGWKNPPIKLNRDNLAIIAWLQDAETKAVLQAFYYDVPSAAAAK